MAEENKELTKELRKLNKNLEEIKNSGKYLIYSANPLKFGLFNFIAGIFHVLGNLFGYIILFGVIAYLFSHYDFTGVVSRWIEQTLQQVRWQQVVSPEMNTGEQFQNLNPEQIEEAQKQLENLK